MESNEELLFINFSQGSKEAFETIFKLYYKRLVVFAKKYAEDIEIAKDIVQDVFIHLFEKRSKIKINTSLKSYLYQSTRNACLNHIEQYKIHSKHHQNIALTLKEETFKDQMEETELENMIYETIKKLPDQCQRIFNMNRIDGLKNQEIADKLKISKRTVETQISKALKFLREELSDILFC
jgi:RNA polymerase sigma-70 factor (family 1)